MYLTEVHVRIHLNNGADETEALTGVIITEGIEVASAVLEEHAARVVPGTEVLHRGHHFVNPGDTPEGRFLKHLLDTNGDRFWANSEVVNRVYHLLRK